MTSTVDLLKYLISQAMHLNRTIHTDVAVTPRLSSYWGAQTESDWFNVLASVLQWIPLLLIIVDIELIHPLLPAITEEFSWPSSFRSLFAGFMERNIRTVLKVALVSYGSPIIDLPMNQELRDSVIPVGGSGRSRRGPKKAGSRRSVREGKTNLSRRNGWIGFGWRKDRGSDSKLVLICIVRRVTLDSKISWATWIRFQKSKKGKR